MNGTLPPRSAPALALLALACAALACGGPRRAQDPGQAPPAVTAPAASQADPLGDQVEELLGQLDQANSTAEVELNDLGQP